MSSDLVIAQQVRQDLDDLIRKKIGKKKFSMQICSEPIEMEQKTYDDYAERYRTIVDFYKIYEQLFRRSFKEKNLKFISKLIIGETYNYYFEFHKKYFEIVDSYTPLFFRTDEPVPGKIVELQIPGSGAASIGELDKIWLKHGSYSNGGAWEQKYIQSISKSCIGKPKIYYIPKSSYPDDRELFQKITSEKGLQYVDPFKETLDDFNYVKSHSFWDLHYNGKFNRVMHSFINEGTPVEPPPNVLSESKIPLIFPFDIRTRDYFTDEMRKMFPYSQLISPEKKVVIEDKEISYDDLCELPKSKRKYIVKYAGPDATLNYGGKGVFSLSRMEKKAARQLIYRALNDYRRSAYWIIQEDLGKRYVVNILDYDNHIKKESRYARFSGFYGPDGLITRRVLFRNFYKVGGSNTTAIGILRPEKGIE